MNFHSICNPFLPTCDDAQNDPNFQGNCTTKEVPTSEEYEDLSHKMQVTSTVDAEENRIEFLRPMPCPNGFRRDRYRMCKKIIKLRQNKTVTINQS